jgi:hypothetical protein
MLSLDQEFCVECGLSHDKRDRLVRLKRMLPCTVIEVYDAYPCTYRRADYGSRNKGQSKMLYRDLRALKAMPQQGIWSIPEFKTRTA